MTTSLPEHDGPGLESCPEEGRQASPLELDIADLEDESPTSSTDDPAAKFAASIAGAAAEQSADTAKRTTRETVRDEVWAVELRIREKLKVEASKLWGAEVAANPQLASRKPALKLSLPLEQPATLWDEPANLVRTWIELPRSLDRCDTEYLKLLRERYAPFPISKNFMTKALTPSQVDSIRDKLKSAGLNVPKARCGTLSAVRLLLRDHYAAPEYTVRTTTIKIAKDESHIIWDGKRYTVFLNQGTQTVKRNGQRIALSTIRRVLGC